MNKRDTVLNLAATGTPGDSMPAAFFLHFPSTHHRGQAAIDKHVEYFRATGNDIMKVQYEHHFPHLDSIAKPSDWADMPCYDQEFYAEPLAVVEGVVKELKAEAVVVVTLYSAFMFAGQTIGEDMVLRHLEEDPAPVLKGLMTIAESMLNFTRGCLDRGADGFYASTQGGEAGRLSSPGLFDDFIKPSETAVWDEIDQASELNILHVCDYVSPYDSFERYTGYPGQIVSAPLQMSDRRLTGADVSELFGRPFLGGMERLGALSNGPVEAIVGEATRAIQEGPPAMILGADCTISGSANWGNISAATQVAHDTTTRS